jgi:hypothetical protein
MARRKIFFYIEVGFKVSGAKEHELAHVCNVVHVQEVVDHAEVGNVMS